MKRFLNFVSLAILLISFFQFSPAQASEKRTDGKPGSEYADFPTFDGNFSIGAHFGALLSTRSHGKSNFLVGADVDYRPYALFGMKLNYAQGVQSPRAAMISLLPLVHTQISNFHPYALFGPGIAIVNAPDTTGKFAVSFGVGGDIELVEHFQLGMQWLYHAVFDLSDFHSISARLSYVF
jgi:hypothetical protein